MAAGDGAETDSKLHKLLGDEVSCPVCYEVFEEPKCLPSCAHNICRQCLEELKESKIGRKRFIECPVCRERSDIPPNGIASFPTNSLLVRLVENTPGYKEEKAIKTALAKAREEIKLNTEKLRQFTECMTEFDPVGKLEVNLKQEISKHAERLIKDVKDQEASLHSEVEKQLKDNFPEYKGTGGFADFENWQQKMNDFLQKAVGCVQNVDKTLDEGDVQKIMEMKEQHVKELKELSKGPGICELPPKIDPRKIASFDLNFCEGNTKVNLGSLSNNLNSAAKKETQSEDRDTDSVKLLDYSNSGKLIQRIESPIHARIRRVAVCKETGDVAVCDYDDGIFIFPNTPQGFKDWHRFDLKFGIPRDITFSIDNELIVLNSEHNQLLFYTRNGHFVNQTQKQGMGLLGVQQLKFISVDINGQLVVTAEINNPRYYREANDYRHKIASVIISCKKNGSLIMGFGRRYLSDDCARAYYYKDKYYIPDRTAESIFLFDPYGDLISQVTGYPSIKSVVMDSVNDNFLVCFYDKNEIWIYKRGSQSEDFKYVECAGRISTKTRTPCYVDVAKDGRNVVVCFEDRIFFDVLTYVC